MTPAIAADWSMFKKDMSHSGYSGDAVNPPLTMKWTRNLEFETESSPVIANDVLYIGTTFGIHALDKRSGKELWTYPTNGFVKSVPAVSNDTVFFGADDRRFYALNAKDGSLKWMNEKALSGYVASTVISNNIVYAMPTDGSLYAFDSNNGGVIWSSLVGKLSESSPAVGEGIIAFGTDGGTIIALDISTGREKWRYDTGVSDIKSSPVIADGLLIIGSNDGSVYALTTEKGILKWKYATGSNIESSPSVKNGIVYFGSRDSNFFAVEAATGELKWKFPNSGQVFSAPAIANDIVYFGTRNNFIYALDTGTGQQLWKVSTGQNDKDYITSPAISGNMLFAVTHDGVLYAYSSENQTRPTIKETISVPVATTAIPEATTSASPIIPTVTPSQTKESPGFESLAMSLVIIVVSILYRKKK